MRPLPAVLAVLTLLAAAACTGSPDSVPTPAGSEPRGTAGASPTARVPSGPSPSPSPAAPTAAPDAGATPTSTAEAASLVAPCEITVEDGAVDSVRIAYPAGWDVTGDCRWFDPGVDTVEEDTEPAVAVSWHAADVPYAVAADVGDELRDPVRFVGARSGYQAVRIEGVATGRGARPAGEDVVLWLVDLDPGRDDEGTTLVGTAGPTGTVPSDVATHALDRMAGTILVAPPATERFVVMRLEGGATPLSVTWGDGCFRLHAGAPAGEVVDEACGVDPVEDGLSTVLLQPPDGVPVLAGLAPPTVARATVPLGSTLSGAVTTSAEGAALFALPARQPPFEVTAVDVDGDVVATDRISG